MFNSLYRSLQMVWRMLRNAILRPFRILYSKFRRSANLTRQVSQAVPKVVKSVTTVHVKPKSREDYVDAGPVYVAKSLVFVVIGVVISLWLLGQFVVWPWMQAQWFTAKLYVQESRVETYSGKVQLYSDKEKQTLIFSGRLKDGKKTGKGTEFDENGIERYVGAFEDDLYSGKGVVNDADGNILYEGNFALGMYEGSGKLYENGALLYEGNFAQGVYQGSGKLYADGVLAYDGQFAEGEKSGQGKAYENGALCYEGGFAAGLYEGAGRTYYPNGGVRADCPTFVAGKLDGACVLYYENGNKKFEGTYAQDAASGQGTLYDESGNKSYVGGFEGGLFAGEGTAYFSNGKKQYVGGYAEGQYEGEGTLYAQDGSVLYAGGFAAGAYEGEGTLTLENGMTAKGTFAQGQLSGSAEYSRNGQLLYVGLLENDDAQGEGVLYAAGQPVYTGVFANGFPDAAAMLDMAVSDVREGVFASAELTESEAENGFVIDNPQLGAAVFCNYGYNDAEIVVHRVFFYGSSLLSRFAQKGFAVPAGELSTRSGRETPLEIPGVAAAAPTSHAYTLHNYEGYTLRLWTNAAGEVDLIEFRSKRDLAVETAGSADTEGAAVDGLLDALGFGGEEAAAE